MLSKYIKNLLEIHSRVIVPDLGAFMLKGDSLKSVYFNEFLRFNDGLLVDYVSEKEKVDKSVASMKVKDYVDNINKKLSAKQSVELEGLGSLYLDANEKIQLKELGAATKPSSQPVQPEVKAPQKETPAETEKAKAVAPPKPVAPPVPEPSKAAPVKDTKAEPPKTEAKVSSKTETYTTVTKTPSSTYDLTGPPRKKNGKAFLVTALVVLVIAAVVYFAFLRPGKKEANVNQNITFNKDSIQDGDQAKATPPVVTKKTEEPTVAPNPGSKKYYVVTGSFIVESNADRMLKKLLDQGYHAEKLLSESGRFHFVTISSFSDKMSAIDEVNKKKAEGHEGAWIFRVKN